MHKLCTHFSLHEYVWRVSFLRGLIQFGENPLGGCLNSIFFSRKVTKRNTSRAVSFPLARNEASWINLLKDWSRGCGCGMCLPPEVYLTRGLSINQAIARTNSVTNSENRVATRTRNLHAPISICDALHDRWKITLVGFPSCNIYAGSRNLERPVISWSIAW